jgi:hypothetical protein
MNDCHSLFRLALCALICAPAWSGVSACSHDIQPLWTEAETSLVVSVRDLATGVRPDDITIDLRSYSPWLTREQFEERELPTWNESFRVVHWPDRTPLAGEWTFIAEVSSAQMRFVPERAFEEGWYALQVRLDALPVRRGYSLGFHAVDRDGWSTVRFHVGSFPMLGLAGGVSHAADGIGGGGDIQIGVSEPTFASSRQDMRSLFAISVDGEAQDCTMVPEAVEAGEPNQIIGVHCPDPGHPGILQVVPSRLEWQTAEGVAVQLCLPAERESWETQTGIAFEDVCDNTLVRAVEGRP